MEIVLDVLLTLFGDALGALFTSLWDGKRPASPERQAWRFVALLVIGLVAGAVSVELWPTHVLVDPTAQVAWLVISPLASAAFVFVFHFLFFRRENRGWPMAHAAALSATLTLWRFFAIA